VRFGEDEATGVGALTIDEFIAALTLTAGLLLAAAGLSVLAVATPASGYPRVLTALLLAGTGIGLAMAPATGSVMGSLPLAKASIGSAMNDTARLVGAAFGVALAAALAALILLPARDTRPGPPDEET
jgi:hypothetical protein